MSVQRRDLLVTPHTPALRAGHTVRTYGVARALAMNRPLDLLYVRFDADGPDESFRSIPDVSFHEVTPSRGVRRLARYAGLRLAGVPRDFARGASPELSSAAARLARAPDRGRVIADGPVAAAALSSLARRRPVIYNAHNIESGFRHELASSETDLPSKALERFERRTLSHAAEAWMVSEPDLRAAHAMCPNATLRLVPNVVDVAAIEPLAPTAQPTVIFVASFFYEPNRTGLRFMLDKVMPLVWRSLPDARLVLVGAGLDDRPSEDPRVEALGFVEDLAGAYARARCAVVPLLQGGGTPLKLIEALAYGLPVIATPRAAVGLDVHDGVDCLIAEGAPEFADALVHVLRDGAPEIALAGRRLAEERYSIEALARVLSG